MKSITTILAAVMLALATAKDAGPHPVIQSREELGTRKCSTHSLAPLNTISY